MTRLGRHHLASISIAVAAAAHFVVFATQRLEAQGLYYDELHQASGSFLLVGRPAYLFAPLRWKQLPLLNMPYSGAAKSILYGEWMRLSGRTFSVSSWRAFGILLAAGGLLAFLLLSARFLGVVGSLLFGVLFLTDTSLLLTSRHDWGPTALALSLRLLWLGAWFRVEARDQVSPRSTFVLGAIPAFLVYEKLSNVVFLVPLAIAVLFTPRLRTRRSYLLLGVGFVAGLLPFAIVNVLGDGISFHAARSALPARGSLLDYAGSLLSLGSGAAVRTFILGVETPGWVVRWEAVAIAIALGASVVRSISNFGSARSRAALLCAVSYVGVAVGTWLLPQGTWAHHWIAATPLQYAAIALAFADRTVAVAEAPGAALVVRKAVVVLSAAAFTALLVPRALSVRDTQRALHEGVASPAWSPSYTNLAEYVVEHQGEASFVLADWGFSTAIHALSNGSLRLDEPFFGYSGREQLENLVGKKPFYVIARANSSAVNPKDAEAIFRDAFQLSEDRTLPVEPELSFPEIKVVKFAAPR